MIKKHCLTCGKEFKVKPCHKYIAKYCSYKCYWKNMIGHKPPKTAFKKGIIPWNKGTKGVMKSWNKGTKGIIKPNSGSFKKGDKKNIGKNNFNWKGDNAGYDAIHKWIYRQKGKPKICKHCGISYKEKRLEWINIDHKYKRDIDDFISLCVSCHRKYDFKNNNFNNFKQYTHQ